MTKTNFVAVTEVIALWNNQFGKTIKRGILDGATVEVVRNILELDTIADDEILLRNLRDIAVMHLSNMTSKFINEGNFKSYEKYNDCMSAITAVIDSYFY